MPQQPELTALLPPPRAAPAPPIPAAQLPAVLARGLTVVVTPLLSLMQDQVQALCALPSGGVPTAYLSSQQTLAETRVSLPSHQHASPERAGCACKP